MLTSSVPQAGEISGGVRLTIGRCETEENSVIGGLVHFLFFSHHPLLFPIFLWKLHVTIDLELLWKSSRTYAWAQALNIGCQCCQTKKTFYSLFPNIDT